jgi:glyoxylase-like metal-dependent hydrolase (beta-lactamase superfamily II)
MVTAVPPLEDELGDVLEKALRQAGLALPLLAGRAQVDAARLRDAIDYRSDLTCDELRRIAAVLGLNEVGLCALGAGRYPLPELGNLPFSVYPLHMAHGIGVANAYLVTERGADNGLLFDAGAAFPSLQRVWPPAVKKIDAVFLTHVEAEHAGGLCDALKAFGTPRAFGPEGATVPCAEPLGEGAVRAFGQLEVTAFSTPGHCAAHNCYLVRTHAPRTGGALLVSGDLLFAGSVGGGYFCQQRLAEQLHRILAAVPENTIVAPGHGPMTTMKNERQFNPFLG